MKKLNAKQLQTLPKDKYHDGNGLYISISKPGRGKWSFRYTINKKSREMGLGGYPDVSLSDARQLSLNNKQLLSKKIDPIDEKNRAEVLRQQQNKKFSDIADLYIRTKKLPEWTNPMQARLEHLQKMESFIMQQKITKKVKENLLKLKFTEKLDLVFG